MPQGLTTGGDAYVHRYDNIIYDILRKVKVIDHAWLYDSPIEEAFYHMFDHMFDHTFHHVWSQRN